MKGSKPSNFHMEDMQAPIGLDCSHLNQGTGNLHINSGSQLASIHPSFNPKCKLQKYSGALQETFSISKKGNLICQSLESLQIRARVESVTKWPNRPNRPIGHEQNRRSLPPDPNRPICHIMISKLISIPCKITLTSSSKHGR